MPAKSKVRKTPKPMVLRDFFGSLDSKSKDLLLFTLNLESNSELPRILVGRLRNDHA
jgi:hypothetical protein